MKRGDGVAGLLFLILWSVVSVTPAVAGPSALDATTDSGSSALVLEASGASCAAGDRACGETADGKTPAAGSQPLDLEAFYSDYESLRSRSPERLVMAQADPGTPVAGSDSGRLTTDRAGEPEEPETSSYVISDPLEPMNRAFFQFNDKLYFWFFKPAAQGYKTVVPETARVGVRNFFTNLTGPIRMVNCLLQGKVDEAGYEFVRLFMNTTVGLGGLLDVASQGMNLERYDEDLGQTLGAYGWEHSIFIHWPFLGPSCGRDTLGMIGDSFLDPLNYMVPRTKYNLAVKTYDRVNETSLRIGDYEDLKKAALDPYVAFRDAYFQYRRNAIQR